MNKKELVQKYRSFVSVACRIHNLRNLLQIRKKGQDNRIEAPCALLKKVRISISGSGNRIIFEDFVTANGVSIYIHGNHNTIRIGAWSYLNQTEICLENDGNTVTLGEHSRLYGKTHLAAIEGTSIEIGGDCLFSDDVHFRTGDSHSLLDMQGKRINASKDIRLGNHVWVGTKVTCLKGVQVPDHCVLGACSVVTGRFETPHCAIAGSPARVVKEGVDWSLKRIPVGEKAADFQPVI